MMVCDDAEVRFIGGHRDGPHRVEIYKDGQVRRAYVGDYIVKKSGSMYEILSTAEFKAFYEEDKSENTVSVCDNGKGINLKMGSEGVFEEYKPYACIDIETEEEYEVFKKMVKFWNDNHRKVEDN